MVRVVYIVAGCSGFGGKRVIRELCRVSRKGEYVGVAWEL